MGINYKIYILLFCSLSCKPQQRIKSAQKEMPNSKVKLNFFNAKDTFHIRILGFIPNGGCGTTAGAGNFVGIDIELNDTVRVLDFCDYGDEWKIHIGDTLKVFKDIMYDTSRLYIPVAYQFDSNGYLFVPRIYYYPYKTTFGKIQYYERPERVNEKPSWGAPHKRKHKQ